MERISKAKTESSWKLIASLAALSSSTFTVAQCQTLSGHVSKSPHEIEEYANSPAEHKRLLSMQPMWDTSNGSVHLNKSVFGPFKPFSTPDPVIPKRMLGDYEVVIMVDGSQSMTTKDCALSKTDAATELSRWQWSCLQVEEFARQSQTLLPHGFSVVIFNDVIRRSDQYQADRLIQVLKDQKPVGDTYLAKALHNVLHVNDVSNKPLAVIVVTDGQPTDIAMVEPEIAIATSIGAKRNVRVMFLAVGKDADDDFLANLVRSLVHFGTPKSSIVYHSFAEFQKMGLLRAIGEMLDEVKEPINKQHN